jgi:hypothetical protein
MRFDRTAVGCAAITTILRSSSLDHCLRENRFIPGRSNGYICLRLNQTLIFLFKNRVPIIGQVVMGTREKTGMVYMAPLDGIRAIAILAVLIFHVWPTVLTGGFSGVDVFFVLSGFLIGSIVLQDIRNGTFSIREFYHRRIQRLLPNETSIGIGSCSCMQAHSFFQRS